MDAQYTPHAKNVINNAKDEAIRLKSSFIDVEHLFLAMLREQDCMAVQILKRHSFDLPTLKREVEQINSSNFGFETKTYIDDLQINKQLSKVIKIGYLEATKHKKPLIGTEHLLAAILFDKSNEVCALLEKGGLTLERLGEFLSFQSNIIEKIESGFESKNLDMPSKSVEIRLTLDNVNPDFDMPSFLRSEESGFKRNEKITTTNNATPFLDNFAKNLTKAAADGIIDPIVGREKEIERIAQILSRRKKNNPMLIGEPGVGKSAIAEGLAMRIVNKDVPYTLVDKKIFTLDLASIVAGTKYRGEFEERLKRLISELQKNKDIILFIDEIHTMVGAGNAEGSLDASNIFKPSLARGEIQCIGATTLSEYRKHIESDGALERRFQKVQIEATTEEETLVILHNIKDKYENYHKVKYSDKALEACVYLTQRYITERLLPDKAIDAMDEAGAMAHVKDVRKSDIIVDLEARLSEAEQNRKTSEKAKNYAEAGRFKDQREALKYRLTEERNLWEDTLKNNPIVVGEEEIAIVVSSTSGVSIKKMTNDETSHLLEMENNLSEKVIGQQQAINKISKSIRRAKAGLKDPNRPIGSFIFVGSTGVGKTLLAKTLAKYLFDSDNNLIRLDMSEYMEKHSVSRLIGSPPGYVGHEEAGQLTEKVRHYPHSIILFDEIEKAHQDIYNILLQILDEGHLTDSMGRKVDFKNTIIIMTSNVGSRKLKDFGVSVGFPTGAMENNIAELEKNIIEKDLKKTFSPEFLNRIDEIIFFNSLGNEDILKIIDLEFKTLLSKIKTLGYTLLIEDNVREFILKACSDMQFGARPLKRTIQREIEDNLSEVIIANKSKRKRKIHLFIKEDAAQVSINIE